MADTIAEKTMKRVIARLREVLREGVADVGEMFEEFPDGRHQLSLSWEELPEEESKHG